MPPNKVVHGSGYKLLRKANHLATQLGLASSGRSKVPRQAHLFMLIGLDLRHYGPEKKYTAWVQAYSVLHILCKPHRIYPNFDYCFGSIYSVTDVIVEAGAMS